MSFKFNFSNTEKNDGEKGMTDGTCGPNNKDVQPCTIVHITDQAKTLGNVPVHSLSVSTGSVIKYVDSQQAEDLIKRNSKSLEEPDGLQTAIENNTDLVPNVYEGGLKVWECSIDLATYLSSQQIAFRGLKVLELGCGAGLPGLYAFSQGATVVFQDYNREVLELITVPNVLQNMKEGDTEDKCKFYAGDWASFQDLLTKELIKCDADKYDVILSSETIYCRENYSKLHNIMEATLKTTGRIYLAAKTYYFGVGGGTRDFEDMVRKKDTFDIEKCCEFSEGVQREILRLSFKQAT